MVLPPDALAVDFCFDPRQSRAADRGYRAAASVVIEATILCALTWQMRSETIYLACPAGRRRRRRRQP